MDNEISISIIIPTHNRADALDLTLQHLREQDFTKGWEVIVVNNNCTDHTDAVVEKWQAGFPVPLRLIHQSRPGPAATRNAGGFAAVGEYLIFIDNDILTRPDFISRHYRDLSGYPGSWFVGHIESLPEQKSTRFGKFRASFETIPGREITPTSGITGQTTSMPRHQFIELGGFDEQFHVASGEDRELALRALSKGIRIWFDPNIVVLHNDWAGTSIRDYCRRQRLYTITEPFFWQKYGNETPRLKMVRENLPPSLRRDGLRLFSWKLTKSILGSKMGQAALIAACGVAEKILPRPFFLWRLYKLAIAGSIYKGFNEGLRHYKVDYRALAKTLPKQHL